MTCPDCKSERSARLANEQELRRADQIIGEERAKTASERESRLRAERERNEFKRWHENAAAGEETEIASVDYAKEVIANLRQYLTDAQKRIEGLETALRAGVKARGRMHTTCGGEGPRACPVCVALQLADAALSSPAVTAEGKKLGDEGGGA